jgi:hypothetical protein
MLSIYFLLFFSTAYIHYYIILHIFVPFFFDYSPVATRALPLWRGVHVAVWHATTVAGFGRFRSGHVTLGRHPRRVDTVCPSHTTAIHCVALAWGFLCAFPIRVVRLDVSNANWPNVKPSTSGWRSGNWLLVRSSSISFAGR